MKTLLCITLATSSLFAASPVYNVVDYGAKNDGSASSTEAIRKAIQATAAAGGGTVYFPAGTYRTGAIQMVSNLTLDIGAGAIVRFEANPAEYPLVRGRYEGTEAITPAPLIGGDNLQNIAITGRGTLTTDNAEWIKATNNPAARAVWEQIQQRLEKGETVPEADYRKAAPFLRPSFIRPMNSQNVLIEGVHIVGSSMWTLHILYCENVTIRNVIVETYPGREHGRRRYRFQPRGSHLRFVLLNRRRCHLPEVRQGCRWPARKPSYGECRDHQHHRASWAWRRGAGQRDRGEHPQCGGQQYRLAAYR